LDVRVLGQAHRALRRRALKAWAQGGGCGALRAVHVEAMDALITNWHGQGAVHLPGGLAVRRQCGRLWVVPP
jgi:tRNA(Ile)-lysidine synthase